MNQTVPIRNARLLLYWQCIMMQGGVFVQHKKTTDFTRFMRYAGRYRASLIQLAILYIACVALLTLAPQALSRFIDSVQHIGPWQAPMAALVLYVAAMLAQTAFSAALQYRIASVGQRITDDHRQDVMAHYLALDV